MVSHPQPELKMDQTEDEKKYKDADLMGCLHWTLQVMTYGAYWLPKNVTRRQIIYYIVVAICTTFVSTASEFAYLVFKARNLEDIVDCSFLLLTHASQALKLIFIYIGRQRLLALLALLETDMFKPKNIRQYKSTTSIRKYTNTFGYILVTVVACTVVFFLAFPVLEKKGAKELPAKSVYPLNFAKTHYRLAYIYQAFAITLMAFGNTCTDITATAFMSQVCMQLEILSDDVIHIKELAEKRLMLKRNVNQQVIAKDGEDIYPDLQKEMSATLDSCVKHHLVIMDFAQEVQSVFSIPIFFQLFAAVGTICMTLFQMSLVTDYFTVRFTALVLYMCCMVMEISVFCWYGNDITVRSDTLSASVYNTDWVDCSLEYKKKVLFLMMHMQRLLRVRVGQLIDLTLANLVAVYRTSWSYFLVLHNMRD